MCTPLFTALIYFSCDAFLFNLRCQTCYWGNVCAKEAFPFQLRFCIAWSCLCGWETWSLPQKTPDPALSRVMALLFMFFVCLAPCICLFVRPPRHTLSCVPSPNSIPDERKDSWCAYVPLTSVLLQLHGGGLMRKGVAVFIRIHSDAVSWEILFSITLSAHLRKNPSTCDRIHFAQFCMLCFVKLCWIWSLFSLFLSFLVSNCAQ